MSKVRVTVNDGRRVTVQEMFLPAASTHRPWIRSNNEPPIPRLGRDPSPDATRARMLQGGVEEIDSIPDSNGSLLGRDPGDENDHDCHCNDKVTGDEQAGERAAHALEKLADLQELQFFRHCTEDEASSDPMRITPILLQKIMQWAAVHRTSADHEQLLSMLADESDNGQRVLDMLGDT